MYWFFLFPFRFPIDTTDSFTVCFHLRTSHRIIIIVSCSATKPQRSRKQRNSIRPASLRLHLPHALSAACLFIAASIAFARWEVGCSQRVQTHTQHIVCGKQRPPRGRRTERAPWAICTACAGTDLHCLSGHTDYQSIVWRSDSRTFRVPMCSLRFHANSHKVFDYLLNLCLPLCHVTCSFNYLEMCSLAICILFPVCHPKVCNAFG